MPAAQATAPHFHEAFEHGRVGSKPTSANTAYDQTIGDRGDGSGAVHVVFGADGKRGHCARFTARPARSVFGFLGKRVGRQKVIYLRRYYRINRLPAYRTSILLYKYGGNGNGQLGGTHNGSVAIGGKAQGHKITLVNNNTTTTRSKRTVPAGKWFRVEVRLRFGSAGGRQTVRLFFGSSGDAKRPTETISSRITGHYTDYIEDGVLTNPNVRFSVKIDQVTNGNRWIGPVTA